MSDNKKRERTKKKWHWLLRNEESPSLFFRKDEKERDVFYPWGYPGKAFYINEVQKREISRFLFTIASLLIVAHITINLAAYYEIINSYGKIIAFEFTWIMFPIWYCYKVYILTKNLKLKESEAKETPKIFYVLLFILFVQFLSIVVAIHAYPQDLFFVTSLLLLYIIYITVIAYFLIRIYKTRGY
ncbi:MAG: hypothetical protein ABW127_00145 [Candidatus Thiodiazotropha endolucinida]